MRPERGDERHILETLEPRKGLPRPFRLKAEARLRKEREAMQDSARGRGEAVPREKVKKNRTRRAGF